MQIWMERGLRGLEPYDDAAIEALRRLKQKDIVSCEITKPRNVRFHRKFFAMLNIVWQSAGNWPGVTELLDELKFNLGHFDKKTFVDRETGEAVQYVKLKSISFAAMDDLEFEQFYERSMRELCVMAGGIEYTALRNEVLDQLAAA